MDEFNADVGYVSFLNYNEARNPPIIVNPIVHIRELFAPSRKNISHSTKINGEFSLILRFSSYLLGIYFILGDKMAFIDDLAFELFTLVFAGVILLYMTLGVYYDYSKHGERNLEEHMRNGTAPLAIVGIVILLLGLFSEMTWPLSLGPGVPAAVESKFQSYNILFSDPYMFAGIVIIAYVLAVRMRYKLAYVGILALFAGIFAIDYGYQGYLLGMTSEPLGMFLMYIAYGAVGILSFPVTLIVDTVPGSKEKFWKGWMILLIMFWIALLGAIVATAYIGLNAIPQHLLHAP